MRSIRTKVRSLAQFKTKAYIEPFTEMYLRCKVVLRAIKEGWLAEGDESLKEAAELIGSQFGELGTPTPLMEELLQCAREAPATVTVWGGSEFDVKISDEDVWETARLVSQHPKFNHRNPEPLLKAFKVVMEAIPKVEGEVMNGFREVGMSMTEQEIADMLG